MCIPLRSSPLALSAIVVALISCACLVPGARADELLAHGTEDMFWVARVVPPPPDSKRSEYTIVRGRAIGVDAQWRHIATPAARVVSLAHRGNQLAALLDNGSWLLLWPGGSATGALPDDEARLLILASGANTIWAVAAGGRASPTTAATAPAAEQDEHKGELALYQLDRGSWRRRAWLPAEITRADLPNLSVAVVRDRPIVSLLRFGGTIHTYLRDDNRWTMLDSLEAADARQIKLLSDGDGAMLWVAPEVGAGRIHRRGSRWSEPRPLAVQGPLSKGDPRTVAMAGGSLRLLFLHDKQIFEQRFASDGSPSDAAVELPAVATTSGAVPNRLLTAAAAAMLLLVVISSMRRAAVAGAGGDAPAASASGPAEAAALRPAPLLYRFVAGVIDASPLLVTTFLIFRDLDPAAREFEQLLDSMTLPFYTALGAYLVYTWLAETLFGRTIGKMIFGLRVVSVDGSRPTTFAILVRNALRLVDVTMLAIPLILVILSPLHQRVGDIAGRTMVVSGSPAPDDAGDPADADEK